MHCGARYGYAASRGRVVTAVNVMESLLIIFGLLLANDAGLLCVRRGLFQMRCYDFGCEICRIDLLNCVGLTKVGFHFRWLKINILKF